MSRQITLDPIRTKLLTIEAREVEDTIGCGFQMAWADGEEGGQEFSLRTGAGVGSPWVSFKYGERYFCIHARDIVDALLEFAHEEIG